MKFKYKSFLKNHMLDDNFTFETNILYLSTQIYFFFEYISSYNKNISKYLPTVMFLWITFAACFKSIRKE